MSKSILKAGSITFVLENSKIADRIFKTKEQNNIARQAMEDTVNFWRTVFMPKRFAPGNKIYNPHVSKQWDDAKRRMVASGRGAKDGRVPVGPQPQDLVFTGDMRKSILLNSKAKAISKNVKPVGTCSMPPSHAIKPNIARVLKFVPVFEYNRLVEVFKAAFLKGIVEGEARQAAAKQGKADAKQANKADKKSKREAVRAARKERRSVERAHAKASGQKRRKAVAEGRKQVRAQERARAKYSPRTATQARDHATRTANRKGLNSHTPRRPRKPRKPRG